jgi:hypothetical protein
MKFIRLLLPKELKRVTSLDFKFEEKFTIVKRVAITVEDFLNFTILIDLADLSADWPSSIYLSNLINLLTNI